LRIISQKLEQVRTALRVSGSIPPSSAADVLAAQTSANIPILPEIERTVELIHAIFHRGKTTGAIGPEPVTPRQGFFVPDAFENPEYQRFAFAGCTAASFCFVLYNALDWPGINTSVLTCIITALSTIGTSVQKLFLRLAGFTAGTLIIGIPAQVLILPSIDTISGFTLFFAAITALAAWFATSSPRLSYFGMQIALAFYFINLVEFHVQTNLTIPRDNVIGILLGTLAMGFMFERFARRAIWKRCENNSPGSFECSRVWHSAWRSATAP
jgi:multidrug resistance protein MdtO